MSGNINVERYYETISMPWGKLLYKMIWSKLDLNNKKILDYGSGFGVTADYLAKNNDVTAIEPNSDMLSHRFCNQKYEQLVGGIEQLKSLPDHSFDVVICHNVLEYVEDRAEVLREISRVLKPDGFVSIVKHNKIGKIMQKAVFEYKIDEALELIHNGNVASANFGVINEYEDYDLEKYAAGQLKIEKIFGIRTFFALQRNELKNDEEWFTKMFELECAAEEVPELRNVAFFHHVIMKPNM